MAHGAERKSVAHHGTIAVAKHSLRATRALDCDAMSIFDTDHQIPQQFIPRHIALVMDGNGRWAQERGMERTEGHKRGEAVLMDAVDACLELGVE